MAIPAGYRRQAEKEQARAGADDLVGRHLALPLRYVRWQDTVVPPDEQLAVANLALVEAARSYPTSKAKAKGYAFGWYAHLRILAALNEARRQALVAYVSRQESQRLRKLRAAMDAQPDRTDAELAEALGWTVEQVKDLRRRLGVLAGPVLLSRPAWGDEEEVQATEGDALADPTVDVETEVVARIEREAARQELARAIEGLSPLARSAISLRFGIPTPETATLAFEDVLRVAVQLPNLTRYGAQGLRKRFADA